MRDVEHVPRHPAAAPLRAPGDYVDVSVELDRLPIARFHEFHRGRLLSPRLGAFPADVRGLLAVPFGGRSLADALFLSLRDGTAPPVVVLGDGRGPGERSPARATAFASSAPTFSPPRPFSSCSGPPPFA